MPVTSAAVDTTEIDGTSGTTSTITGVSFGTAFAGRVICVMLYSATSNPPTSVTIAGITANVTSGSATGDFIASAVVPTGTSGNVVATFAASDQMNSTGAVALTGAASAIPTASNNVAAGSNSIDVPAGGTVLAFASNYPATTAGTWSGVNSLIAYKSINSTAIGSFDNAGGLISGRSASYSNGTFLNLATFSPAFIAAPNIPKLQAVKRASYW